MWVIFSYVAAVLTTVAFVPQLIKVIKTKNTGDISLFMYIGFVVGVICWLIYGVAKQDIAIIIANGITALLASVVLTYKVVNVMKGEKP